jgi:hypothetical protein
MPKHCAAQAAHANLHRNAAGLTAAMAAARGKAIQLFFLRRLLFRNQQSLFLSGAGRLIRFE